MYECLCSAEHKGIYSEECGKQSSSGAPLTSVVFVFPTIEVNGAPKQSVTHFLQNIFQNKDIHTGLKLLSPYKACLLKNIFYTIKGFFAWNKKKKKICSWAKIKNLVFLCSKFIFRTSLKYFVVNSIRIVFSENVKYLKQFCFSSKCILIEEFLDITHRKQDKITSKIGESQTRESLHSIFINESKGKVICLSLVRNYKQAINRNKSSTGHQTKDLSNDYLFKIPMKPTIENNAHV